MANLRKIALSPLQYWRPILLVFILAGAFYFYASSDTQTKLRSLIDPTQISVYRETMLGYGWKGVLNYIFIYSIFIMLGLPNLPFQLAAGAIYGTWKAWLMMYIGANLGALGAFTLARVLGRDAVEKLAELYLLKRKKHKSLENLKGKLEKGGFRLILLLRLTPLVPFNLINYTSGISRIRLRHYIAANLLGLPPLTYLHVALGEGAGKFDLLNPLSWTQPELFLPILGVILTLLIAHLTRHRTRKTIPL